MTKRVEATRVSTNSKKCHQNNPTERRVGSRSGPRYLTEVDTNSYVETKKNCFSPSRPPPFARLTHINQATWVMGKYGIKAVDDPPPHGNDAVIAGAPRGAAIIIASPAARPPHPALAPSSPRPPCSVVVPHSTRPPRFVLVPASPSRPRPISAPALLVPSSSFFTSPPKYLPFVLSD